MSATTKDGESLLHARFYQTLLFYSLSSFSSSPPLFWPLFWLLFFFFSIANNHDDLAFRLIARDNAPHDLPNKQKMTPLHLAASLGKVLLYIYIFS